MCIYMHFINKYTLLQDACSKYLSVRDSTQESFLPTVQGVRYLKCGPQTWEHFRNAES